jgi:hypothetical protein
MDGWGVERGPGHGPDLPESIISSTRNVTEKER